MHGINNSCWILLSLIGFIIIRTKKDNIDKIIILYL